MNWRIHGILIWEMICRIEVLPMSEAKQAVEGVWNGKVRYRYVLEQDIA